MSSHPSKRKRKIVGRKNTTMFTTRVQRIAADDGLIVFMIKVRIKPDFEGQPNDSTVEALMEEAAAIAAIAAAYGGDGEKGGKGDAAQQG